jgi:hypothetical protein
MAVVPLIPITFNVSVRRGAYQQFKSSQAITDLTGAAIDLSAWDSMTATLVAPSPNPNTADVTFGTLTGNATGFLILTVAASALSTNPVGSAQLICKGVHVAADPEQLLSTGTFQLAEG